MTGRASDGSAGALCACALLCARFCVRPESVTTPVLTLPTVGGATFDVMGTDLGLTPSAISVSYAGGSDGMLLRSHTLAPSSCTIVSPGTALRCPSLPGVGANYSVTVVVDGGMSDASASRLSYAPPVINSLSGEGATGASTTGGAFIFLRGANFGPVNGTTVTAWASPVADDRLVFPGRDCVVVEPHVTIRCTVSSGIGAALSWRVVVEGQANSMPLASYAAPVLLGVQFVEAGVTVANTQGGTLVSIRGSNFGDDVSYVEVSVTTPAGVTPVPGCALATNHTALVCALPAGVGAISLFAVTVLGQTAVVVPVGLAYAPPVIVAVGPSAWSTDLAGVAVTLTGSGFGPPALSALVNVTVTGVACGGLVPAAVSVQDVTVRSDTQVSLTFGEGPGHVVASWAVSVTVAGQTASAGAWNVSTRVPTVASLSLDRPYNGTHYFLVLTGSDFGPVVGLSSCPGDLTLTADGTVAPVCDALTMTRVRGAAHALLRV
jgi:hypothetical protein